MFESGLALTTLAELDDFARQDGFENWRDMSQFWESEHPDAPAFSGWLIRWREFQATGASDAR